MTTQYIRYPSSEAGIPAYPLKAPNGTAAAPSFTFVNATGTGLYLFGANSLGFSSNGLTAGHIDSSQNWFFVGTANAPGFISTSANVASAGQIRLANADTIKFRNSGNSADIAFAVGSTDTVASYAGIDLANISSAQIFTNKTLSGNTAATLISGAGTLTLNTTGTVTLPNATDTLVGKATTDTLTNKTLSGNTAVNLISGSGTLTLNTSGTVTVPNGTDTLVSLTATQTLTGKSVSFPTTGGTPATLNFYETGTFSANFNAGAGAGGSGTSLTVTFSRLGNLIFMTFPSNNTMTMGATSASLSTAASTVPSRLAPAVSLIFPVPIKVNNVVQANFGALTVGTDGSLTLNITINAASSWTSATSNNGVFSFALGYSL